MISAQMSGDAERIIRWLALSVVTLDKHNSRQNHCPIKQNVHFGFTCVARKYRPIYVRSDVFFQSARLPRSSAWGGRKTKMAAHYSRESITTILGGNGGLHVIGPDRPVLSSVHYK